MVCLVSQQEEVRQKCLNWICESQISFLMLMSSHRDRGWRVWPQGLCSAKSRSYEILILRSTLGKMKYSVSTQCTVLLHLKIMEYS